MGKTIRNYERDGMKSFKPVKKKHREKKIKVPYPIYDDSFDELDDDLDVSYDIEFSDYYQD